jgi:hypothetical protein
MYYHHKRIIPCVFALISSQNSDISLSRKHCSLKIVEAHALEISSLLAFAPAANSSVFFLHPFSINTQILIVWQLSLSRIGGANSPRIMKIAKV